MLFSCQKKETHKYVLSINTVKCVVHGELSHYFHSQHRFTLSLMFDKTKSLLYLPQAAFKTFCD